MTLGAFLLIFLSTLHGCNPTAAAADAIFDLNTVQFKPSQIDDKDKHKIPCGTAETVDGKFGKAFKFTFIDNAMGGFMTAPVRPTTDWNRSAGFSFWVKGDGSRHWGGIELIDRDDFSLRYGYCFPIDSMQWRKITVPWRDVIPELAGPLVNPDGGYAPDQFGNLWFGKWFYWRDYPAESYTIDQVMLEQTIDEPPAPPVHAGLSRVAAKLKAHEPITIVTMGDSLSDKHHWSNHDVLWSELLAKDLKTKYASEIKLVNPSIGGTTLSQNTIIMPRWSSDAPSPDLVVVWFGGNDWNSNVRGERFADYLRTAVDRIRRQTHGSADVLLMTTCPAYDRWETYAPLEQAARKVAKEKQAGLADVAAEFRNAGDRDSAMKQQYWAWDKVHLGANGKEISKDAILKAIESQP